MNWVVEIRFECPHCGCHHTASDAVGDVTGDMILKCSNCSNMIAVIWAMVAEATVYKISSDYKGASALSAHVQNDDYTDDVDDIDEIGGDLPS